MNIQICGTKKCKDTRKAERFFKERGIRYQFVDMKDKGMSKGEFNSVAQSNGGPMAMLDIEMTRLDTETCPDVAAMERSPLAMAAPKEAKDQDALKLVEYIAEEDKVDKIIENQHLIRTPIVRNGKQSTVGHQPEIWKEWCN